VKSTITEGVLFQSPALGETRWTARSLEGVDAFNQEYSFRVRLDLAAGMLTQEELERVLEAPATLFFVEGELELNRFSGVVESLTSRPDIDRKRTELDLTLVPRVALAAHRRGSELFLERTIPEVLFEKLAAWGLKADEDFASLLRSKNVIRTGSNNELVLEDLKEHERIRIHTPHAATTLQMGSPEEAEEGFLLTTEAHVTAASRRSNNTVTDRQTTIARSSTTVLGERLVMLAGVRGIAEAASPAIERPGAASAERIAAGLHRLTRPPIPAGSASVPERPAMPPIAPPAEAELHSDAMARASERSDAAAIELVRTLTRTAEAGLEAAMGRIQGEPLGEPTEPAAILGSDGLAALIGRENVLVSGDRTATLSSTHSATVVGHQTAVVKSAGEVEVAGGRSVHVTSGGVVDVAAKISRIVAGYYPEAEAPELDDGTSLGVMSRRDLRIHSVEDCILVCANKNLIGSAHEGDVRLHAKETVLLQGGSLQGSAGQVAFNASEDTKIEAGGAIAMKAAADVTIEGATVTISAGVIRLVGSVFVEGDLMCSGNSNLK
jgi:hypothetical protein